MAIDQVNRYPCRMSYSQISLKDAQKDLEMLEIDVSRQSCSGGIRWHDILTSRPSAGCAKRICRLADNIM